MKRTVIMQSIIRLSLVLFFTTYAGLGAQAQVESPNETVQYMPVPNWVLIADIPAPREEKLNSISDGIYYLLSDKQADVRRGGYTYFQRTALKVINRSGLENAGRLQFIFDPTEEAFALHHVRVVRNGNVLERFDPSQLQVMRQESDLSNGITNGNLTAYYEIPDIRVGDIIDYAISWDNKSQLWPGQFSSTTQMRWSVPVERQRLSVRIDKSRELAIRYRNLDVEPSITTTDTHREYVWEQVNSPLVPSIDNLTQSYAHWGKVSVSTFGAWSNVTTSLLSAYNDELTLPDAFIARKEWLKSGGKKSERITAAIRFVQDEIRYVGDETGVGSHLPRSPVEVLERGWGDCKDKALLLVAILRYMGVEAYATLTDVDNGYALPQVAPSPFAFDHVIVAIDYNGKRQWIDATSYNQGGVFPDIQQPSYGYGLLIKDGDNALIQIQSTPAAKPRKTMTETYDMKSFYDTGVTLKVETEYLAGEADTFRRSLGSSSLSKFEQDYLKYYRERYPGMEIVEPLTVTDDRDANKIISVEQYTLARTHYEGTASETNFPLRADAVIGLLPSLVLDDRTAPISLKYPVNNKHIIRLENVGDFTGLDNVGMSTEYFEYSRVDKKISDDVVFSYHLKTLSTEAPITAGESYRQITSDLDEWGYFEFQPADEWDFSAEFSDTETIAYVIALVSLLIALIYLPFGIVFSFKKDNFRMGDAVLHPVSLRKFIFLSLATFNLYSVFWMWRNWRWLRKQEGAEIQPFWRAFFSVIWFYPLFGAIRDHQKDNAQTPIIFGASLAILYVLTQVLSSLGEAISQDDLSMSAMTSGIALLGVLCFVPLVHWVNKLNMDNPEAIIANSKWTGHTIAALFSGFAYWALILTVLVYS